MPKQVNHDARRREIAEALLRLAAREGLESVSLRHVAAEAGISMGAVQHYFHTKDEMLQFALEHQERLRDERIGARLTSAGAPPTVRSILRTCLLEVLPTDEQSRAEWLVNIAYFIRAVRDPLMAAVISAGVPKVVAFFTEQLEKARNDGELAHGVDVREEAVLLWSCTDAQSTAIVLGQRTPDEAVATLDYYLDRLFAP